MNDRKKWIAAALLLLLGFGVYFTFRSGPAHAPDAAANVAPPPSAAPSETAAPIDTAPAEAASASDDAPAPRATVEPRVRAAAPTRPASLAKKVEAPAKEAAKVAPTAAPIASAAPTVAAAPIYPALVGQFMNRVGQQFRLLRVTCSLDGQTVYSGPGGAVLEIFRKMPPPGHHTVAVVAEYQGNGGGVFSYFDGYKFTVRGSKTFASKGDAPTQVTVAATEKGGVVTSFQDRLALMINVR